MKLLQSSSSSEVQIADLIKFHQIKNKLHFCQAQGQRQKSKLDPEVRSVMGKGKVR